MTLARRGRYPRLAFAVGITAASGTVGRLGSSFFGVATKAPCTASPRTWQPNLSPSAEAWSAANRRPVHARAIAFARGRGSGIGAFPGSTAARTPRRQSDGAAPAAPSSSIDWRGALAKAGAVLYGILLQGPPWAREVAPDVRRPWQDPQLWTHACFLPAFVLTVLRGVWDLLLLLSLAVPISLIYHRRHERSGALALVEGLAAKALFTYGVVQLFYAPTWRLLFPEAALFGATSVSFLLCKRRPALYDPWHAYGLHCGAGAWATFVASAHAPLIAFP